MSNQIIGGAPTIKVKRESTAYPRKRLNGEKKKIRKIKMKKPNLLKNILISLIESGIREKRMCDPSNGGMGIKLNIANNIFMETMKETI